MSTITKEIDKAANHLLAGNVVAIPTETVYGLAAIADNDEAVKQIYALKNRPLDHPLIMHVSSTFDVHQWVEKVPDYASILMEKFWPGPLTLVFQCRPNAVNPLINAGKTTVAIRCPAHPLTQKILECVQKPLVAPSANPFGKISPTTATHVQQSFTHENLLILDGGRCRLGIESTIIAATHSNKFQILRHGSLAEATLQQAIPQYLQTTTEDMQVPGRLKHHYQPEKAMKCFENREKMHSFLQTHRKTAYVISFAKDTEFSAYMGYRLPENPDKAAYEFYYQLRLADASASDLIVMELPANLPQWQALRERAIKAAHQFFD